jgi:hypothetical protein
MKAIWNGETIAKAKIQWWWKATITFPKKALKENI